MSPHRRKNYLINPSMQLRYALYIFLILAGVSIASMSFFSYGMWSEILKEFSITNTHNRLVMATQIYNYINSRRPDAGKLLKKPLAEFEEVELLSAREREILEEKLKTLNKNLTPRIFALFIIVAVGTVFLSHKVAGPLYRFKKVFEELNEGNLTLRVRLRKDDRAQELVPEMNKFIANFDYTISSLKHNCNLLFSLIGDSSGNNEEVMKIKESVEKELNRYKTSEFHKF